MEVIIRGIGAIGPGFNNWHELQSRLLENNLNPAERTQLPSLELLPPAERRRASPIIKAGIGAGLEACLDAGMPSYDIQTVFTSSGGDGANCVSICQQLATSDRLISPTKFHNSVHNTVAGYWGIATGCMRPSQVIGAGDGSFAAGLFEAAAQTLVSGKPCLLVSYDTSYPEPLNTYRRITDTAAIAAVLDLPGNCDSKYPGIQLTLGNDPTLTFSSNSSISIPTLSSLTMLSEVVNPRTRLAVIPFQPNHPLIVKVLSI